MADIALVTANRVLVVDSTIQFTAPALEAVLAGAPVRFDPTTGKWANANGTDAAHARIWGTAVRTVAAGEALTAVRTGLIDGFDLSGMAYDDPVYLSDTNGRLSTTVGTVTVAVGRVVPGIATTLGTVFDKILSLEL